MSSPTTTPGAAMNLGNGGLAPMDPAAKGRLDDLRRSKSMLRIFAEQFLEHRMATASLALLLLFGLAAIGAPVASLLTGLDPAQQNILNRYAPAMTVVRVSSQEQESLLERRIEAEKPWADALSAQIKEAGLVSAEEPENEGLYLILDKAADPEARKALEAVGTKEMRHFLELADSFKVTHYLGTDELGRDVLVRLVYGARVSLAVAALVGFFSAVIGLGVGSLAGYYGGLLDTLLMRLTDTLLSLPAIPIYILLAAVDLKRLPVFSFLLRGEHESLIKMVLILVIFAWMPMARLVRGAVLSVKESEYVLAAKTLGARDSVVILSHVVPNVLAPLIISVTLGTGDAMLAETALSFLGLGIQPPTPSWGNMLQNAMELVGSAPLLAVFPGLLIFIVVLCVNFVGDGLRDALDPKAIRR